MSNIREQMQARAKGMQREEEFEVKGMDGIRVLAVGLMTGDRNRLLKECTDSKGDTDILKITPRVIAMTICDPDTRQLLWNVNSLDDHNEINALPPIATTHMQQVAFKVCGLGEEATEEGKAGLKPEDTNSSSSLPPVLAVA